MLRGKLRKRFSKTAWFLPHTTVSFVLVTTKSKLASKVRKVVEEDEEEGKRIDVKVRVVETAGTSFKQKPVQGSYRNWQAKFNDFPMTKKC